MIIYGQEIPDAVALLIGTGIGWMIRHVLTRQDKRIDVLIEAQTKFMAQQTDTNAHLQAAVDACEDKHRRCEEDNRRLRAEHERETSILRARVARLENETLNVPPSDLS